MSNPTSNFGWQMPQATDLVTDLPADFEVFGQAVDTDFVDLLGGTTGQVLSKTSATDLDFTWVTAQVGDITGVTAGTGISGGGTSGTVTVSIDTAVTVDKTTAQTLTNKTLTSPALTTPTISTATTNGDLLYGTGSGALARLGIGSSAQVLTVASGIPSWATPAAPSGKTMSLIASGTASGASLTISSLTSYDTITVLIFEMNQSATGQLRCRINNDSTSNYWASANVQTGSTTQLHFINAASGILSYNNMASGATNGNIAFTFTNCQAAGFTGFQAQSTYKTSGAVNESYIYAGALEVNAAVSSLVFTGGGNWSGTTNYRVYGA